MSFKQSTNAKNANFIEETLNQPERKKQMNRVLNLRNRGLQLMKSRSFQVALMMVPLLLCASAHANFGEVIAGKIDGGREEALFIIRSGCMFSILFCLGVIGWNKWQEKPSNWGLLGTLVMVSFLIGSLSAVYEFLELN